MSKAMWWRYAPPGEHAVNGCPGEWSLGSYVKDRGLLACPQNDSLRINHLASTARVGTSVYLVGYDIEQVPICIEVRIC